MEQETHEYYERKPGLLVLIGSTQNSWSRGSSNRNKPFLLGLVAILGCSSNHVYSETSHIKVNEAYSWVSGVNLLTVFLSSPKTGVHWVSPKAKQLKLYTEINMQLICNLKHY